jgi:hypothetical protein
MAQTEMMPKLIEAFFASNRRNSTRVTSCGASLDVDGANYVVNDFSRSGFEAALPTHLQAVGKSGAGVLKFTALGWAVEQDIDFTVVRVTPKGNVGATFIFKKGRHWRLDEARA